MDIDFEGSFIGLSNEIGVELPIGNLSIPVTTLPIEVESDFLSSRPSATSPKPPVEIDRSFLNENSNIISSVESSVEEPNIGAVFNNEGWVDQYFDFSNISNEDLYMTFSFSFDGFSLDANQIQNAGFEKIEEFFIEKNMFTGKSGVNYDDYQFYYKDGCILGVKEGAPILLQSESDSHAISVKMVTHFMNELNFTVSEDSMANSGEQKITGNIIFRNVDTIDSKIMNNMMVRPFNNDSMQAFVSGEGAKLSFHTFYTFQIKS